MALNQQVAMERIRCYKPFNGVLSSFPLTNPMHGLFAGEHPVIHHRREIAAVQSVMPWRALVIRLSMLGCVLATLSPALGKSIFDDDWTPPPSVRLGVTLLCGDHAAAFFESQ